MRETTISFVEDTFVLSGPLTVKTVPRLFEQTPRFQGPIQRVDLEGVSGVDSSGLALLVHWMNEAKKSNSITHYVNAPQQLKNLADLCSLERLMD